MKYVHGLSALAAAVALVSGDPGTTDDLQQRALRQELSRAPHRLLFESNRSGNWDIWIVNADGSGLRNLTNTTDMDEIHAHASPDGTQVVFIGDRVWRQGRTRRIERATYLMNIDGTDRRKIADGVQQGCWKYDGSALALVRSNPLNPTTEYETRDLLTYDLKTRQMRSVRSGFFHHIFALTWSTDGRWFLFAQHGMKGFEYQLMMTDAEGQYVYSIKNYGCRPDFCPDGSNRIAWNTSDQDIAVGVLDPALLKPGRREPIELTDVRPVAHVPRGKVYYVDWSPDAKYLAFSRSDLHEDDVDHGFKGGGNWRVYVTRAEDLFPGRVPLSIPITFPPRGCDDKEPDWVPAPPSSTTAPAATTRLFRLPETDPASPWLWASTFDRLVADFAARLKAVREDEW